MADDPNPHLDFGALPEVPERSSLPAEWWIAMSHLRSKKRETFVSLVTVLSVLGVVAGVAVLNWVISVMTGFEVDLREKILGTNAHVVVLKHGGMIDTPESIIQSLGDIEGIEAAAPFLYKEMMIRSPWDTAGIILKGVDPEHTWNVTSLDENLVVGPGGELTTHEQQLALFRSLAAPIPPPESAPLLDDPNASLEFPGLFLGSELQQQLQVGPGDTVQLIDPLGTKAGPLGMPVPSVRTFRVAGIFYSGMYEYDTKWTYAANHDIQKLQQMGEAVTGIEVRVSDPNHVARIADELSTRLSYPYYTRHWMELNEKLFEALRLEKYVMGLILSMIVIVAALLIVTTLIMLVITKGREIAILKAMGASSPAILRIFVIEGSLIGLVGTSVGTLLGLFGCAILENYGYPLETDVYYLSELPVVIDPANVVTIAIGAFSLCFLATLYPAWKAASINPVEGLRYE